MYQEVNSNMKAKRILIPIIVLGGMTLASCSQDLVTNYSKSDLQIDTPWVDYNIPITSLEFSSAEQHVSLERGTQYQYNDYRITPKNATNRQLIWQSSNEAVATISDTGLLTGVEGGHAQITVGNEENTFHPAVLDVDVTVDIESFNVSYGSTDLDWNHEYTPTVTLSPADTTWTNFTYSIPEAEQTIATVDESGVITTYGENGTVHLTIINEKLGGAEHAQNICFDVRDRKIHVSSIALSVAQGASSRIELGTTSQVVAEVTPNDAQDIPTLQYFSRDDGVASVDPTTGVVTGNKPGIAKIFALCEGVTSNDVEIEVFEVYATSISINNAGPINIDALDEEHTQITVTVGVSEQGATKPSLATPTFSSSDDSIVTVGDNGELTVRQSGTVTITASIQGQSAIYTDTIQVNAKAYVTAISFDGPVAAYLEDTVTITAILTPASVEDSTVTWDVNPANKVESVINGNQITLTPLAEGPVTLTATSTKLGISNTHTVSFTERKVEFEEGEVYLVGNKQFNTGTSVTGVASWTNAKYAYHLTDIRYNEGARVEAHARMTLDEGTEFKLRIGPDPVESWRQNYEQAGAIDRTHLSYSEGGNVKVLTAGVYDIYYKFAEDSTYIGLGPVIHFDKADFSMGKTSSTKIVLHDYEAPVVSCISSDTSVATVSEGVFVEGKGMEYTVTAVAPGTTTITATDNAGHVATSKVEVRNDTQGVSTPIYLNANGIFDDAGAVPFIHAYNANEDHQDLQMTLVEGQSMIYSAEISEEYTNVIFVRMPSGSTTLDWDKAWNESKAADSEYGDNNMFTITGYDQEDGKYLTGTWGVFDPNQQYKVPADFYLAGDFNSWAQYDEDYALVNQSTATTRKYVLENVYLEEGSAVKVHDKELAGTPEEEQGAHWYANASEYPNCHYTLVNDGYGGKNMAMDASAYYDIEFYPDSEYANTIVFSIHGAVGASYYLKGTFDSWGDGISLAQDPNDSNKYFATGVSLTEGDKVKGNNPALGDAGWYGVSEEYANCHFTVDAENNAVINETASYTVNLYINSDNGNHLEFIKEGTPIVGADHYLLGLGLNNWTPSAAFLMTQDQSDSNKYTLTGVELTEGDLIKANNPALGNDGWYGVAEAYENCHFTVGEGGNAVITDSGTYTVNLYINSDNGNHLQFIKEGSPVVSADIYLLGLGLNNWTPSAEFKMTQNQTDGNKYTLEGVELTAGDLIKGNNPALGDDGWYGVDHVYDNCYFTVGTGGNAVISESGTYTVNLYVNSDDGNHLQFIKTGGGDTPVVTTADYYLKGDFNSWVQRDDYKFTATSDPNKFTITNVTIHAGEGMKGYKPASGSDAEAWYGVANEYTGCGWTVNHNQGHEGDCVVSADGVYTVDLYLVDDYGTDNHLVITKTADIPGGDTPVDPQPTTLKTFYFTNNYRWSGTVKAYVWDSTGVNETPVAWPGAAATFVYTNDLGEDVYSFTIDTSKYDYVIFNVGSNQTVNLKLSDFGSNNACYISGQEGNAYTVGYWNYAG